MWYWNRFQVSALFFFYIIIIVITFCFTIIYFLLFLIVQISLRSLSFLNMVNNNYCQTLELNDNSSKSKSYVYVITGHGTVFETCNKRIIYMKLTGTVFSVFAVFLTPMRVFVCVGVRVYIVVDRAIASDTRPLLYNSAFAQLCLASHLAQIFPCHCIIRILSLTSGFLRNGKSEYLAPATR